MIDNSCFVICNTPYSPHHRTFPASFSSSATILTSLLFSSPSSLFPYISFFPSLLFYRFLQPRSPLTAAPGTDLLAPNSRLPTFLNSLQFIFAIFPPGHHISAACSKLCLARSSYTSLPLPISICLSFLLIHSVFPAHSSAFSFIFSTFIQWYNKASTLRAHTLLLWPGSSFGPKSPSI